MLTSQFAYGSLIWLPRLFAGKAEAEGYTVETAAIVGSLFAILLQLGGILSILAGHLGDRWQRRDLRGRATLSALGIWCAISFYVALFFLPLHGLDVPEQTGAGAVVAAVLASLVTNPWVSGAFFLALVALALTSIDSPNWFALISDVNLPEHRGTVFGLGLAAQGIGRSLGNGLTGAAFAFFGASMAPPLNLALGLALFQLFFVPTGLCYYLARRTIPKDIGEVRTLLVSRAEELSATVDPGGEDR